MSMRPAHSWDLTPKQAAALQRELAPCVIRADRIGPVHSVAGVDVGFEEAGRITRAAVAVLDFPTLTLVESAVSRQPTRFPYVPGLLSFREIPAVLEALAKLCAQPDLLLCDGHGYAHPRRFGLACHLGLVTDIPSIGVGKSRLVGTHDELPEAKGSQVPLVYQNETIGVVLRTRNGVSPVFVSVGHRTSLDTAVRLTLDCTPRYRLPETTRQAHRLASVER